MRASHSGHVRSRLRPLLLSLLTLASLPRPLPAADIRVGEISYPGEQDVYSFRLETPATLYFDVLTNAGSINWSLSGPPGNVVVNRGFTGSDADGIGDPLLRLPDGDYTLTVAGSGSSAVGYRFQMLNFTDATLITMGTVVSNAPAVPLSTQLYQFTANAGDVVTFDSLGITGGTGPFWRLVDPYGRIVFANYFSDVNSLRTDFS
jgi:large repetitive protein